MTVVVDVWGGPRSMEHLARYFRELNVALEIARREIAAGFLVNLRAEAEFGPGCELDRRAVNLRVVN